MTSEAVGAAGLQLALASRRGKRRQRGAEADRAPEEQSDANGKQQCPGGVGDRYKCVWPTEANERQSAIAASNTTWTATQPPPLAPRAGREMWRSCAECDGGGVLLMAVPADKIRLVGSARIGTSTDLRGCRQSPQLK